MKFARVCCFAALLSSLVGCQDEVLCEDESGNQQCWTDECFDDEFEVKRFPWTEFESCDASIEVGSSIGRGGGDCTAECTREFPGDYQLDSFCMSACCYAINGQTSYAEQTCQAGAVLGTDSCRYCP